ncbi:DJ-1/PfpI family protein [Solimonas sp. K1W22B-7]|uniref:DJ-1 family glyoxalase III n=1 Tax=Solimonas sp. K1W22B-7 TaxID=2303331 RepID=UPI000E332660|nr:DJ-1 family glyoxalase III [Solimonas sp. K1W22B-7]AXQ29039.1 DJ-1/PfpI family protein [Solimonas sp. K1W22B-7]
MNALVVVAHGSESLEAVTIINVLRRGDVEVTVASIESSFAVEGTRGVMLTAEALWTDVGGRDFDLIVLPGGEKGAQALSDHAGLVEKLKAQRQAHRWTGAICASPALVLSRHGLLDGKKATCYPAFREQLLHYVDLPVVVDGHCVTGQGPASALAFGLQLVEVLRGADQRKSVAQGLLAA